MWGFAEVSGICITVLRVYGPILRHSCDTGLGQSGLRQWRRLFKKAKIQVHSEGACAAEQMRPDEIAYEVFGNIEKVEATGNENENGKGHALAFRKVVEGCVWSSLIVGDDEPEEVRR